MGVQEVRRRDHLRGLRLVEASLRLREDHEEGYERDEDNEERDQEEQQNIKEEIHPLPARRASRPEGGVVLWSESPLSWRLAGEVHGEDKEHLGCDV